MKTLNKKDFIKFLKSISKKLDNEEIKHELPYCHMNKKDFNHNFIIIPDHITIYDISKIFNCEEIKERNGIIKTKINNFFVNFVKTKNDEWNYTFYFFNWDIIHIFVDILINKSFGLKYTRKGLKYCYNGKYIHITKNLKDIFDFLELKFNMIIAGFSTEYMIFEFIQSSPFYDSSFFTLKNFKKYDPYFEYNKHYYKQFIKYKLNLSNDKKSIKEKITYIDVFFSKSNFLEKLSRIQIKEEYPNLKEKEIIIKPEKKFENLTNEKKPKIKKINLKKIIENKNDNDFNFNIK